MKVLNKEQEDAHYASVIKYGTIGGAAGLAGSWVGLLAASRRWALIRNLTLPMKGFLVSSACCGAAVIAADQGSQSYSQQHEPRKSFLSDRHAEIEAKELAGMSTVDRLTNFARREKYKIIGLTWVASMIGSWVIVGRNPYLSSQQKIVQARVYAQGLTLGVLCASAAFEIHDQRQGRTSIVDAVKAKKAQENGHHHNNSKARYDDDLWKDMVAAEEEREKAKEKKK